MRRQKLWLMSSQSPAVPGRCKQPTEEKLPIVGNGQLNRMCNSRGPHGGLLTEDHIWAANRLERLVERAMLTPQITRDYCRLNTALGQTRSAGQNDISDMAADARKELASLYDQLPADCINLLVDVCGFSKGLQEVETSRKWPRRSAKLVAKIGLDQLGAIWGIGQLTIADRRRKG